MNLFGESLYQKRGSKGQVKDSFGVVFSYFWSTSSTCVCVYVHFLCRTGLWSRVASWNCLRNMWSIWPIAHWMPGGRFCHHLSWKELSPYVFDWNCLVHCFLGGSLVRSPKVQVLKQVVALHRGLVAPGLEGAPDADVAPSGLVSSNSTDSLGLEDVENEEWFWCDAVNLLCMCLLLHYFMHFPSEMFTEISTWKKKQHVQVGTCRIHLRKHLTRRPSLHPLGLIPMMRSGGYTSEFSFWPCSCCNMFCFPRQLTADRLMKRQKHPLMSSLMVSELVPRKCLMPRSGCSACSLLGIGTCKFVQLTPHQTSTTYLGPLIGIGR